GQSEQNFLILAGVLWINRPSIFYRLPQLGEPLVEVIDRIPRTEGLFDELPQLSSSAHSQHLLDLLTNLLARSGVVHQSLVRKAAARLRRPAWWTDYRFPTSMSPRTRARIAERPGARTGQMSRRRWRGRP